MTESNDVSFRSHVQSADHGVSIVVDTPMHMLQDGFLSFRLKSGITPHEVSDLIARLRDQVDKIEYHHISKPIFEKV